mgnify:CR=1 FL=1
MFPAPRKKPAAFEKVGAAVITEAAKAPRIKRLDMLLLFIFSKTNRSLVHKVFLVTNNANLLKVCDLYANEITVIQENIGSAPTEMLWDLVENNKDILFKEYDQVAVLNVSKYVNTARANSITIFDQKDFTD